MEITDHQRSIMQHTISDPGRNWFATDRACEAGRAFEELVTAGLATSETPPAWMGDGVIYRLTPEGKAAIS